MATPALSKNPSVANPHRRGSAYMMVLVLSMMITTIGITAVTISKINTQSTTLTNDWLEAQHLAYSSIEHAISSLEARPGWRKAYLHNTKVVTFTLGRGSFSWKIFDLIDTDLTDDATDPFEIIGEATVGEAVYKLSIQGTSDSQAGFTFDTGSWKRVVD